MPRRHILTEHQRHTLLALPTDEPSLLEHYTLTEDDMEHIRQRRRPHNRLGFALQLCALRYPGRLLSPGEVIPHEVLRFLATQLVLQADDLLAYASREETRHEHLAILRRIYGYKTFRATRALKSWLAGQAELRADDVVVVTRLDRLARSTSELLRIAETIEAKRAGFQSIAEPWGDTTPPAGRMVLTVFTGIAEFARADRHPNRGRPTGRPGRRCPLRRPPKLRPDQRTLARHLIEEGKSVSEVARTFNVHVATIYRCLHDHPAL